MWHWLTARRFGVQLILVFIVFSLGTVIALGIPVSILLNRQTDQHLRALLEQTNQTSLALYENKLNQLNSVATLLVERPTLGRLLNQDNNRQALDAYLDEFIENVGVDLIAVCGQNRVIAFSGIMSQPEFCTENGQDTLIEIEGEFWLLSFDFLRNNEGKNVAVVVGKPFTSILQEFHIQTGLNYVFLNDGSIAGSNEKIAADVNLLNALVPFDQYQIISLVHEEHGHHAWMVAAIPLPVAESFSVTGMLDVESFLVQNRQLRNLILLTLLSVGLIGGVGAVIVSRRISQPLNQLARSAAALREGDLNTRLETPSKVWEIDQLTNALEDARVGLKHSLDQLRVEKAWVEDLLNAVVEVVITIDEKGRITFASESIEKILGVNIPNILGESIDHFFKTSEGEDLFSHQLPGPNQKRRISVRLTDRDALLSVSASYLLPSEAGNADRALVIRDVTDEERIHRLIGEFLANITHEFRTPLTALSASVALLVEDLPQLEIVEIEELLNALNIGIIDLQSLIDNLIEAASIEAGRFSVNPQPIELNQILMDAIQTIDPIAQKYRLTIIQPKTRPNFLVNADRRRTSQALINLLSNAIKHSPENGQITLATLMMGEVVLIEVQDEGSGVLENRRTQLFKRFILPGSSGATSQLGMGLGLSVVKAIIEAQQGQVGYKDREPHGAIFWFTLPLYPEVEE